MDTNPNKVYIRDYKALLIPQCSYYQTREEYNSKTGLDAPPFDPKLRAKRWQYNAIGPLGNFTAKVLAEDPDGEVLRDPHGFPFLMEYSFSPDSATKLNLPSGTANSPKSIYPSEAWIPLRDLAEYEELVFKEQLPEDAGLIKLLGTFKAFLVDSRYRPVNPEETIPAILKRIEEKIDTLLSRSPAEQVK